MFFATSGLAKVYRKGYPKSLNSTPFLLPKANTALRQDLESWFALHDIHPHLVGEFEDSAMQKAFGQAGKGIFPGSSIMKTEICRQYQVEMVGDADHVKQRFYAHTVDRRIKHQSVLAISEFAKQRTFSLGRK